MRACAVVVLSTGAGGSDDAAARSGGRTPKRRVATPDCGATKADAAPNSGRARRNKRRLRQVFIVLDREGGGFGQSVEYRLWPSFRCQPTVTISRPKEHTYYPSYL
mmetsp:Transcript_26113/g.52047  ORF Transcript_26113/g.52047 Transcript_26113/m.52047 type:complete len:106 (-) Transcript_26113:208-525(-)